VKAKRLLLISIASIDDVGGGVAIQVLEAAVAASIKDDGSIMW